MKPLLAQSQTHALELVYQIIREYAAGISNRLEEAAALAELWCLDIDVPAAAKEALEARKALAPPSAAPRVSMALLDLLKERKPKPAQKVEVDKGLSQDQGSPSNLGQTAVEVEKGSDFASELEAALGGSAKRALAGVRAQREIHGKVFLTSR